MACFAIPKALLTNSFQVVTDGAVAIVNLATNTLCCIEAYRLE